MNELILPLLGAGAGAVLGSFVANLVMRWPQGRSVVRGRSVCEQCGHILGVGELVPLMSFIVQRGRCRRCSTAIDPAHFLIELAATLVGATALFVVPGWGGVAGMAFGLVLIALAALDMRHFWVPDLLTLPLLAVGLLVALMGHGPALADSVIGAAAGYGVLALLAWAYRRLRGREGLGGGDPKMLGAIGAWLGWQLLPMVLLVASLIGLLYALATRARGVALAADAQVPLGAMMAVAAWPLWILSAGGVIGLAYI
ncbi:A24 family peptidase [Sphingomonas sp. C3-2]|uniref:prepilin peptidase n=1 Tax=Sphingomonas sp. C3-2 TaxID=3062169 RepID=UPI00294B743C|nr:A24 family peptidase [Sphingomonas sp. C3-2]WOK37185.1 A24 family peptidase [Sphingomonas sp. C3-2]